MARIAPGQARKLLLVGWGGADWGLIAPRLDRGVMPALDALIGRGTMARLSGLAPSLSPLVWTSIATGKRAEKHGVLAATEPDAATGLLQPISARARRTSALWEILDHHGLAVHAIGWPASDPASASATRGVVVSDRFARAPNPIGDPWPLEPGDVSPGRVASSLAELRIHPGDLCAAQLRPFLPRLAEIDLAHDHRPAAVAAVLAEAATVHAAATWVLEHEPWDFLAVHYAGLEQLCDPFLRYAPPRLSGVSERDGSLYGEVVAAGYRFFDQMLARLVELAGDDATVMLVSDHGYSAAAIHPEGRDLGAVRSHEGRGIFVAAGPGLRNDELIHGAGPLDIAPTTLTLFGLPVGADMDGRPLRAAWEEPPRVETIPSWDDRVDRSEALETGPADPDEALADLRAQGYDDGPPAWLPGLIQRSRFIESFHLAMVHLDARRTAVAVSILEVLHNQARGDSLVTLYLAYGLAVVGDHAKARRVLESLGEGHEDRPLRALVEAITLIAEGRIAEAVGRLDHAGTTHRELPEIHTLIGHAYDRTGRIDDAARAFERAIAIDEDRAEAHEGLARCHLRGRRWEAAADSALTAVGIDHHRADAHLLLGLALIRMGRGDRAAQAIETALAMRPGWPAALDAMADLRAGRRIAYAPLR